jgi:predicted lactoylglutathione lyase
MQKKGSARLSKSASRNGKANKVPDERLSYVTMVTLGVSDLARATKFYQDVGFERSSVSQDGISFMRSRLIVIGLFPIAELSKDVTAEVGTPGKGAVVLAQNHPSKVDVDRAMAVAIASGATIIKTAQKVFWGGYSGYYADPDGHLWEVAYNPFAELGESGCMNLPGATAE